MTRTAIIITFTVVWIAGLWLLNDGFLYALYATDASVGRLRGCYTAIELSLNLKQPSEWIRPAEQVLGALLFFGVPTLGAPLGVRALIRRRHPK